MEKSTFEIFQDLIIAYSKTGRIGRTKPYDYQHARKIAWAAANRITKNKNKKINTTSSPSSQGTEPLTGCQTCSQLKLF